MNAKLASLVFPALLTAIFMFSIRLYSSSETKIDAIVLHCRDGDTCRIKVKDAVWFNVRLTGIDAPEVKGRGGVDSQPLAIQARDFLNNTLKNQKVQIRQTDLDHYNRPVVEIFFKKNSLNLSMLEKGFAEAYRGKAKRLNRPVYLAAEKKAKDQKLGIWKLTGYMSPQTFRRLKKK